MGTSVAIYPEALAESPPAPIWWSSLAATFAFWGCPSGDANAGARSDTGHQRGSDPAFSNLLPLDGDSLTYLL